MKNFSLKESILGNIILIACSCLALVLLINGGLKLITQHGKEVTVPDFTNLTFAEATGVASDAGVKVYVGDSVYVSKMRKDAVYSQSPKAGSTVKHGRKIMLTTNSRTPSPVAMPPLVQSSMHVAKASLANAGLNLGKLIYKEDKVTNYVIDQLYKGRRIKAGTKVMSGSTIDLVVGYNPQDAQARIPDLVGKKYVYAIDAIHDNSFNVGKVTFDSTVKTYIDSLNAVVVKQKPASDGRAYNMGKEISIELSLNHDNID